MIRTILSCDMMRATVIITVMAVLSILPIRGQTRNAVVADSVSHTTLPGATVFDSRGNALGMTDSQGRIPYVSPGGYPITVRFLGFKEKIVPKATSDTIFMHDNHLELPEVIVESHDHQMLHMLAYVREYSTLTSYTDTVFLFREKMVDYMLVPDKKLKFKGWSSPRVLTCRSYYRFTDHHGLDSVSDVSTHHFSWSDWIGAAPVTKLPQPLLRNDIASDTLHGKYNPAEIWSRHDGRVAVDVNVLADTASRKWVPALEGFFKDEMEFETFRIRFNYNNVIGDVIAPLDLTGYSFNIESNGRGHKMFMFNRHDQPFYVTTYAEVYMLDKEYITVKEARKWAGRKFDADEIGIYVPPEAPDLQPSILELVDRVENIDKSRVRLDFPTDLRLAHREKAKRNFQFGRRVLSIIKDLTGISSYKFRKNANHQWKEFTDTQKQRNKKRDDAD